MSNHAAPARRRFALPLVGRKTAALLLTIVVLTAAGTSAWGYWSSLGGGSGSATTGTLNAPTQVVASSSQGPGKVQVTWDAPKSGATPDGYYVVRIAQDGGTAAACGSWATVLVSPPCTDTSVPDGTYSYAVTAVYRSWTATSGPSGPVTVVNTIPTSTTVSSSANPSVVGQAVTYTATVTPGSGSGVPSGDVTFKEAGLPITCTGGSQTLDGSGVATCQVSYLGVGTHTITAAYGGEGVFNGSTSSSITQTVNRAQTSTSLTSDASPNAVSGQTVTYTATVTVTAPGSGVPSGTVDFKDGSTSIACTGGTQTLSTGVATCKVAFTAAAGGHTITAVYPGDSGFAGSSSATVPQGVNPAATSTALISSANPSVFGQMVTFTATVSVPAPGSGTPTGSVTFKDGSATITCAGGNQNLDANRQATCQYSGFSVATHSITAVYNSDGNYASSTSNTVPQVVNQAATTTAVTASSANPSVAGQSVTLTATVSVTGPGAGTPSGTVAFTAGGSSIGCDAQPVTARTATCTYTFPTSGARPIAAAYSGGNGFNGSTSPDFTQTVNTAATTTSVTTSNGSVVANQVITLTATVTAVSPSTGRPSGSVGFSYGTGAGTPITCQTGSSTTLSSGIATCRASFPAGAYTIKATYNGDGSYLTSSGTVAQTVTSPVSVSVTGLSADSGASATDGITNVVAQSLSGTAGPNGTITISRGSSTLATATANGSGSWTSSSFSLAPGSNSLTAMAFDAGGNTTTASFVATLDTTAPTGAFTAPATVGTTMTSNTYKTECSTNFSVCGTASDAGGAGLSSVTASMLKNGTTSVSLTGPANGSLSPWSFQSGNLQNGSYSVTVTMTDKAGNVGTVTTTFTMSG